MIWLMEGLSSQRGILQALRCAITTEKWCNREGTPLQLMASHRNFRPEITGMADVALSEPVDKTQKLAFIFDTIARYSVTLIHTGRADTWFEEHRPQIEAKGVVLITGTLSVENLQLADDKYRFSLQLAQNGIAHTPACLVESLSALKAALKSIKSDFSELCIKPNQGIYGCGYWRLDDHASADLVLRKPESRRINTQTYLDMVEKSGDLSQPMLVMPYLPGPECSIDIVTEQGRTLAVLGRRKNDALQQFFTEGEEIELARRVATLLHADGLINVQTRADNQGKPLVLECNLRPSGGVPYGLESGINLPAIMVASRMDLPLSEQKLQRCNVRILDHAVHIPARELSHGK
ncbi:MAG: ATP-grasp domain-containing protein [Ewingella sp.]